jgi:dolichyl-phosphate beta-glucosyltransferase
MTERFDKTPKILSVVIPAFNEEVFIVSTLKKIKEYLDFQNFDYEILVVDDGSTDRTAKWSEQWFEINQVGRVISLNSNYGKGRAVRTGMLAARGDYCMFTDADSSTSIEELEKCWPKFEQNYDIVIGSRALSKSVIARRQTALRYTAGLIFRPLRKLLVLGGVNDTQCGFKCFKAEVAQRVFSNLICEGFIFDVEALFLAHKMGYRIAEIPVVWTNDPHSKLNTFSDSLKMFCGLLQIRYRHISKQYQDLD